MRVWAIGLFEDALNSLGLAFGGRCVGHVAALLGDVVRDVLSVVPDAPDERGSAPRLPGQAKEIHARLGRHAPLMPGPAFPVNGIHLQPSVVSAIARRPNDRRNAGSLQLQTKDRVGRATRHWQELARLGLLRPGGGGASGGRIRP